MVSETTAITIVVFLIGALVGSFLTYTALESLTPSPEIERFRSGICAQEYTPICRNLNDGTTVPSCDACNSCKCVNGIPNCTQIACSEKRPLTDLACATKRGQWDIIPKFNNGDPICNLRTKDAGKICTDSDQCESYCKAAPGSQIGQEAKGTCYELRLAKCIQEVNSGKVGAPYCI